MDNYFSDFQRLCIGILAESDNCQESQDMFRAARSVPELATAWQHYWAGVLHEVPEQVICAFSRLYPQYRADIIRAGIYYNEAPPADAPASMVLIGDGDADAEPLVITGRHRVYVLGSLPVTAADNCNVHIVSPRSQVELRDHARCNIEAGQVTARDRSTVSGRGSVTCYDSATVFLYGGTLTDHGHLDIRAYNDAVVHSFTSRRITLSDQAILNVQ